MVPMEDSLVILGLITSFISIFYLMRGLIIMHRLEYSATSEEAYEQDRAVRMRIFTIYPDHSYFTIFVLSVAVALNLGDLYFYPIIILFIIIRYTQAFGLLNEERKMHYMLRNLGTIIVLSPWVLLTAFVGYQSVFYVLAI